MINYEHRNAVNMMKIIFSFRKSILKTHCIYILYKGKYGKILHVELSNHGEVTAILF